LYFVVWRVADVIGQSRLVLGPADDDSSVNSLGSLGSGEDNTNNNNNSKAEMQVQPKKKRKGRQKHKSLGVRQNVDKLLERGDKIELLYQLHPCIQRRLAHTLRKSPSHMTDEELEYEDEEEEEFASMMDRLKNGTDNEDDAVALEYLDDRVLTPMYR
jgi:hypothetical protein